MFHTLRSDVDDGGHDDIKERPADKLFRIQVRTGWEVVLHVLETRKDGCKDILNAEASGP